MMIRSMEEDLETLRTQHRELIERIQKAASESTATGAEAMETPRVVPTDTIYPSVFDIMGVEKSEKESLTSVSGPSQYETTAPSPSAKGTSSIFKSTTSTAPTGSIFKSTPTGGPVTFERGPIGTVTKEFPPEANLASTPIKSGTLAEGLREEMARIEEIHSGGLVAPPNTPTTSFLPIVQPFEKQLEQLSISTASQGPTESSDYSESLDVVPEVLQVPPLEKAESALKPKTFLIPCHVSDDSALLGNMVAWAIQTLINPGDSIKILISGQLSGEETYDGYISHMIGNQVYAEKCKELESVFPRLVSMIENTGLSNLPFQIEVRQNESLGWSMRSEFQWPHVYDQLVVVVPSHLKRPQASEDDSFEAFVLRAAPCPVIEFPTA